MIAIITDDFTGAAEMAGLCLLYTTKVELYFKTVPKKTDANIIIVCTDTRSGSLANAKKITAATIKQIQLFKPTLIYKKVDSLLRGYVLEELQIQMKLQKKKRALLLPANPSLHRIIKDGKYYINNVLLTKLPVAKDPEFPITSAVIKKRFTNDTLFVKKIKDKIIDSGIIIGDTIVKADFNKWVALYKENTVLAGAADFFVSLIDRGLIPNNLEKASLPLPNIYLCGTALVERKLWLQQLEKNVVFLNDSYTTDALQNMYNSFRKNKKIIVAITDTKLKPLQLRKNMAVLAQQLILKGKANSIFIEGGATAAAFLQQYNIKKLEIVTQLQRGVVMLKYNKLIIIVKPGSYALPIEIEKIFLTN